VKRVRRAVYTRKSSEEGLEQGFNSLHAQREACEAYIRSQASEGWTLIGQAYDDGGLSGGTLERPALQQLLADVRARRIDIVVVYKVDRLTRSLLDFAGLVEAFDAAGVSFVSVTQSFNTTTSMGRLTLNMLLSFAQFEREVTAERIRDKIAASKAKGMWMGGTPPIGYAPSGRSLAVVPDQADLVRRIFALYLEFHNVRTVAERLAAEGVTTPVRTSGSGRTYGGQPLGRGQIYKLLANPIYIGEIAHAGVRYPGQHEAIVDRAIWDRAQALLAGNAHRHRAKSNARDPSPLAGKLFDDLGEPLVATHATKRGVRYRYYVSRSLQHGTKATGATGVRVPAAEIEAIAAAQIASLVADPLALCSRVAVPLKAECIADAIARASALTASLRMQSDPALLASAVERIDVARDRIAIALRPKPLLAALGLELEPDVAPAPMLIETDARLQRSGRAQRIAIGATLAQPSRTPDAALMKALQRAHRWWGMLLADPSLTLERLAHQEQVAPRYLDRLLRLRFLSPETVDRITAGTQPVGLDLARLQATALPLLWDEQARTLLG